MFHSVMLFGGFSVIPFGHIADKITCYTADSLEMGTFSLTSSAFRAGIAYNTVEAAAWVSVDWVVD